MNKIKYQDLVKKISKGEATDQEIYAYNKWFNNMQNDPSKVFEENLDDKELMEENLLQRINYRIDRKSGFNRIIEGQFWKLAIASSVLIFSLTWLYFSKISSDNHPTYVIANDIDPGGDKATLTLADGSIIALEQQGNGSLISEGSVNVTKQDEGIIVYQNEDHIGNQKLPYQYHKVTTPMGGKYQIVLPDKSKVYLNAGSSITFPTKFSDHKREVELEGECFFEVAKDSQRPFLVHCKNQTVEVIGTQFNVNGYNDESSIKTTLTEGSIKVKVDTMERFIVPGQQFSFSNDGDVSVTNVDVDQVVAWRNGLFHFWKTDIKDIMKQLSRWYDIEVVFDGNFSTEYLSGFISREVTISNVLQMLEKTGNLRFSVEGKRVTVHHLGSQ